MCVFGALMVSSTATALADSVRGFVTIEAGPAFNTRNDVQIPNSSEGTRFSLRSTQGGAPIMSARLSAGVSLGRHGLRALIAPLTIRRTGESERSILFSDSAFGPGPLNTLYEFNSYRLTYRYTAWAGEAWTWRLGVTGKIRDARIQLRQEDNTAENTNVGFVPLLHANVIGYLTPRLFVELDLDGLASPGGQGRAVDARLSAGYKISRSIAASIGYRLLEGGADTSVYNFALVHYATADLQLSF